MSADASSVFWEITAAQADEFVAKGHRRRHFFPHRTYRLPKCGPDGFGLAQQMGSHRVDPGTMWQLVLYADPATAAEFPAELFFDDDVAWHRQQFGVPGHVASATVVLDGSTVRAITYLSDLVQRISRRREHKTRIEKRFEGWRQMLLNAVLAFAADHGAKRILTPTATLAHRHTAVARLPRFGLFERIYDRTVNDLLPARREGEWWVVDRADFANRFVSPQRRVEVRGRPRTICVCHRVERWPGHLPGGPEIASRAAADLEEMRRIEADLGVRATYFLPGELVSELKPELEADRHALAFHSFGRLPDDPELKRCRMADYRIKGYRHPAPPPEVTARLLVYRNFEWIAGPPRTPGASRPRMWNGLVRLPIAVDQAGLRRARLPYCEWERRALDRVERADFAAISLDDCCAPRWLPRYRRFLARLGEVGELATLDEAAAEVTLSSAA